MRVLLVSHYFPPHVGGIEYVVMNQAWHLAEAGHEVVVMSSGCGSDLGKKPEKNYRVVRVPALNLFEANFGVPFPIFSPSIIWNAYKLVSKSDVVHIHDALYICSWITAFWARLLEKPVVVTQHVDIVPHPNKLVVWLQKFVYTIFGAYVFRTAQHIFILNGRVQQFVRKYVSIKTPVELLPNGVDTKYFTKPTEQEHAKARRQLGIKSSKPVALFIGRFVPKKGFDILIKAASKDYDLMFVGGDKPAYVEQTEGMRFEGKVAHDKLLTYYHAADMFVLPSEGEGFPLTIQEAMACGLPIITTNDRSYNPYKFDAKLIMLVDPKPNVIKDVMKNVSSSPKLMRRMSIFSQHYAARHFEWDGHVERLVGVYSIVRDNVH